MKKINLFLVFFTSFMIFQSCSNDSESSESIQMKSNPDSTPPELTMAEIKELAQNHNIYLDKIHSDYGDIRKKSKAEVDSIFYTYLTTDLGIKDEAELSEMVVFSNNVRSVTDLKDLLPNTTEKNYVDMIDAVVDNAVDVSDLNAQMDIIENDILNDPAKIYKTPLLIYAETIKSSAFYWAPPQLGGSGQGDFYLQGDPDYTTNGYKNVIKTDGRAAAAGFIGLASYGAWGVLFGPVGFALTAVNVVMVGVTAGIASAMWG